jgi:hypothetical protein
MSTKLNFHSLSLRADRRETVSLLDYFVAKGYCRALNRNFSLFNLSIFQIFGV